MSASLSGPNALPCHKNGVATRPVFKRTSPPRSPNVKEINFAYVDSQILQRPKTTSKRATPAEAYDAASSSLYPEFEIDAYASNEDLIKSFVSANA